MIRFYTSMKKRPKAGLRADGKWEAKGVNPATGRRKSYYGDTPEEASQKAWESFGIRDQSTLYGFYLDVYFPTVLHRSVNWRQQIAWAMDGHISPVFGASDLKDITRADAQRFFNGLKLSPKSKSHVKKVFSGIMALAEADEIIDKNPVASVRIPPVEAPDKTALTPSELWRLYEASHGLVRPFVLLAGFAGLRLGEAVGMTWKHVSEDTLMVRQQVLQLQKRVEVTEKLKTPQAKRDIPAPFLHEIPKGIWMCANSTGGYVLPKNITRELKIACKKAEVPIVSPHELRHTFITIMENELECPASILKEIVGHAKDRVTGGYSHPRMDQKRKWMQKYWQHVSSALRQTTVVNGPEGQVQLNLA